MGRKEQNWLPTIPKPHCEMWLVVKQLKEHVIPQAVGERRSVEQREELKSQIKEGAKEVVK